MVLKDKIKEPHKRKNDSICRDLSTTPRCGIRNIPVCPEVFSPVGELDQVLGEDNKQSGSTYGQVYYCKLGSGVKVLLIFTARAQWDNGNGN